MTLPSYTEGQRAILLKSPPWVQAVCALGQMIDAFAPAGTVVNVTEQQGEALSFARAVMDGNRHAEAVEMWRRIIAPLEMGDVWCNNPECGIPGTGCHVHLAKVVGVLIGQWFEVGSQRAQAAFACDTMRHLWEALHDATREAVSDKEVQEAIGNVSLELFSTAKRMNEIAEPGAEPHGK